MNVKKVFDKTDFIFSDFDGTITKYDVIHSFIAQFAKGDTKTAEDKWSRGEISTKECLNIQIGKITELKKSAFDDFINSIEIDPYFIDFYKITKSKNKKIIILSDGFDYFIVSTLKRYGLFDIKIFSNHLEYETENGFLKFKMTYPNGFKNCSIGSGCCKCNVALSYDKNYTYIGDGLSDRCIAKKSALLFAKKSLETFCKNEKIPYFPYKTFQDITEAVFKENSDAADGVGFSNRIQNQRT